MAPKKAPAARTKKSAVKKAAAKKASPSIARARKATTGGYPQQVGAPPPQNQ